MSELQSKYTEDNKGLQWCNNLAEWYNMNKRAVPEWFKYCKNEGYCDTNGIEIQFNGVKLIEAELKDLDQCDFIEVDPNFPLPADINPTRRNQTIFYVLQYCYFYNNTPTIQNVATNSNKLLPINENKEMTEEYGSFNDYNQTKEFKLNPNAKIFPAALSSIRVVTEPEQKMDKPFKKKRKKKSKPKRYSDGCEVYDPDAGTRGQGNIRMSRPFTQQEIPNKIMEISIALIIFGYLDIFVAMQHNDRQVIDFNVGNGQIIPIYNVDLHDKITKQVLYLLVEKQDATKTENRNYPWKSIGLWTVDEIAKHFQNSIDNLPQLPVSSRQIVSFTKQLHCRPLKFDEMQSVIKNTEWHKINILHKIENKVRRTLSVDKLQFINKSLNSIQHKNKNDIVPLIPLVLFRDDKQHFIAHLYILPLVDDIDIGISFEYKEKGNTFVVRDIHLNKDMIELHHKLAMPEHDCNCIDSFKSNIDALQIGNPDKVLNQMKDLKKKFEKSNNVCKQFEEMKEFCKLVAQCGDPKLAEKAQHILMNSAIDNNKSLCLMK